MPYAIRQATGTAGKFVYDGVSVVFKQWTCKMMVNYADSTDSKNYDSVRKVSWRSQEKGDAGMEGTIEGYYDLNGKTAGFVEAMFSEDPVEAVFGLDQDTVFATVPIDITDFDTGVETDGANMIAFTCNWKSNGIPTIQTPVAFDEA